MKIIYISGAYIPSQGANAVHVMHQCEAFASLGHEVTLIARTGIDMEVSNIYEHYNVKSNFKLKLIPRYQIRVIGAIMWAINVSLHIRRRANCSNTVIYAREIWALYLSTLLGKIDFIYETHWKPEGIQKLIESRLSSHKFCRGYVFISNALEKIYLEEIPKVYKTNRIVAHDAAQYREVPDPRSSKVELNIGYVGSFREGYGIPMIIRLAQERPEHTYTIIGGTDSEVAAIKKSLSEDTLNNLNFEGFVAPKKLGDYYKRFDVMLAPYGENTDHIQWISPMKLFEYMSYGKPVLCSDFPVLREVVRNGVTGYLLPSAKIGMWIDAIDRLSHSPQTLQELGANAYRQFSNNHTWSIRGKKVLSSLYEK